MANFSYGDLTTAFHRSMLVYETKTNIEKLSIEIASGEKSDLNRVVGGNFTPLAAMERTLRTLESYQSGIDDADFFTSSLQNVLSAVSDQIDAVATPLLTAASTTNAQTLAIASETARAALDTVISSMNTRAGGRALLSGAATQTQPLEDAETMLTDISAAITGLTTSADIVTAVDAWFAPGTGSFDTVMYNGSTTQISGFVLNEHEKADIEMNASNQEFRDTLKGLVLGSLVAEGQLAGNFDEQASLQRVAGETLFSSGAGVEFLAASVGAQQAKIEAASTRNTSEEYAAERAKAGIVAADIYDSAGKLTQAEGQLEMMYTITARLSRLKLSDYI